MHDHLIATALKSSVVWAGAATVGLMAVLRQVLPVPQLDGGLFPMTLGGWVGMLTGIFAITAVIIHAWKNPSEKVAQDVDRKMLELEKRIDRQIALLVADMENAEHATEKRIAIVRETDAGRDTRIRTNEMAIAIGARDREYMVGVMDDLKRTLDRIVTENKEHNLAILAGITKIAGGVRGMMPLDYPRGEK